MSSGVSVASGPSVWIGRWGAHLGGTVGLAGGTALLLVGQPEASLLVVGGTAGATLCWARPDLALYLLLIASFSVDYLAEEAGILPRNATFINEALLGLLVGRAMLERRGRGLIPLGLELPLVLLMASGTLAAHVHETPLQNLLLGFRALFRFLLFAYAAVNIGFKPAVWRRAFQLFITLMLVQLPVALYQWLALGKTDDQVFGSVRSTGVLAILIVLTLCLLVARYFTERPRPVFLVMGAVLFVLPILGEAKAFFIVLPIGLAVLLRRRLIRDPRKTLRLAAIVGVPAVVALLVFGAVSGNADLLDLVRHGDLSSLLDEPRVAGVWERQPADVAVAASVAPRLKSLRDSWDAVAGSWGTFLFGYGIGSRTFSSDELARTDPAWRYVAPLATRLYELGVVGMLLYWSMFMAVVARTLAARRAAEAFWRSVRYAFPAITVVYLFADVYTDTLYDPLACTYWLVVSMLVVQARLVVRSDPARDDTRPVHRGI